MIPDRVSCRRDPPHQLRLRGGAAAQQKKRRPHFVLARMSSSRGVHVAFGPSSKVSASSPGRAGAIIAVPKMREPGHSEA